MIHAALRAALIPSARGFRRALADPERAQGERLRAIAASLAGTKRHAGLARVRTLRELAEAAPLATPASLAESVGAMARGEKDVLTRDPLVRFERSGGSSGAAKLVPHTRALLAEFQRALLPWIHDLLASRPALRGGPGYWSISPIGTTREMTPAGIPVGSEDDGSYFPSFLQPALRRVFAVPSGVARLSTVEACRYATLRFLLEREDLALVSVWNPSFLGLLLDALDANAEALLEDLARGVCSLPGEDVSALRFRSRPERARALRAMLRAEGRLDPVRVWPRLALVSMWTDAEAARAVAPVAARLPGVEIQGKGLLATEGVVTIPLFDAPAPVLAVRSHVYEFLDEAGRSHAPHEVETGRSYEVAITTGAGFVRYRLGDLVRVDGFLGRTPCLRFLGRADATCDVVGEKLGCTRVSEIIGPALERLSPRFSMLAPEWSAPPAYRLFLESEAPDAALAEAAARVEAALREAHGYRYARELGQLGPVTAVRVRDGAAAYEARCVSKGQRAGNVKPVALHRETGWTEWFGTARKREENAA